MTTVIVASENALRTAIQRKLIDLARTGRFYAVNYDNDGFPQAIDPDTVNRIKPKSCIANELDADFEPDILYGRSVNQKRASWKFELHLGFDHEITGAFFEQDVIAPVPRINSTKHHTYAILRLTTAQYEHPARDGSAGGSSIVYTWEAQIGR